MKSKATSVIAKLDLLLSDRKVAIETVRRVVLDNVDTGFQECMQYCLITYSVPQSVWPHGHHTRPELPLPFMYCRCRRTTWVDHMLFLLHNKPERVWFE